MKKLILLTVLLAFTLSFDRAIAANEEPAFHALSRMATEHGQSPSPITLNQLAEIEGGVASPEGWPSKWRGSIPFPISRPPGSCYTPCPPGYACIQVCRF